MIWAAVAVRRVAVTGHDDLHSHRFGADHGCVEIGNFKPKQHSVAVGLDIWITNGAVVMLDLPPVKLKDQSAVDDEALVLRPAVGAPAAEQLLIPAAARLNVFDADERLWMHVRELWVGELVAAKEAGTINVGGQDIVAGTNGLILTTAFDSNKGLRL